MTNHTDNSARWDLTALYRSDADPAIDRDLGRAARRAESLRKAYRSRIASAPTAELIRQALAAQLEVQRPLLKVYGYAQLLFSADGAHEGHKQLLARVREAWSAVSESILFLELEIVHIIDETFAELMLSPLLTDYRHHLTRLRAEKPYTLDEAVEQALKRKDLSGKDAFSQLFDELTAALRYTFTLPGEKVPRQVSGEELLALLYHPDAALREAAFTTYLDEHARQGLVLTSCFNNILLDHGREAELRNYPELMTPTHLSSETEPEMVTRMMAVTEDNYGLAQEYFRLKAELLGVEQLKNTDLYAPLGRAARKVSYGEAQQLVLAAYGGFSPRLAKLAAGFFDAGRIDPFPRDGKSGGAFCLGVLPEYPPYLLLNHTDSLRDVTTLAHELGHGVHFALSGRQNLYYYHAPLPLAETASVFGEMLLTRHLLDQEDDPALKVELLCAKLEDIIATTFRQNVLTRFELAAHRLRGERLLAAEDFCDLWWQENRKLFGEAVTMIEAYRWGWSYISHFIHARFYCYSYVFGELLTLSLYRRYQKMGEAFVPLYEELLASGGSQSPQQLLRPFGIDLDAADFWQQGYDVVRELLTELRGALAELN
ncbi:MAG: M3 family oligoendopeptidase [Desulfuromonadaceae bacterium]|nr:M3 family oligoendopeptidase [Desulfuromonadaceae bacterium]